MFIKYINKKDIALGLIGYCIGLSIIKYRDSHDDKGKSQ